MDVPALRSDPVKRHQLEQVQRGWRSGAHPTRHVDPIIIVAGTALALLGLLAIYSARFSALSSQGLPTDLFVTRQAIALGIGLVGMAAAAAVDYRRLRSFSSLLYLAAVVLLLLTLLTPLGQEVKGAKSWIILGGFQFQPSELAKIGFIIAAAAFLHERTEDAASVFGVLALLAPPLALIVLQPDPGTGSVLLFVSFAMLLVAGVRARWLVALGIVAVVALGVLVNYGEEWGLLEDHQVQRLTSFANPEGEACAQGACYNTDQSLIAIGSGQFAGKGLFQGTQTNLSYVPENHTDFVFSVIGEEFGFVGAMVILSLFAVLLFRCLRVAAGARDRFGMLVASGIAALFAYQLFVNVGMTVGIMPVIGIPLPFVSYGGTALISSFVMLGLVLNVHMRRFRVT
jgi:rod shape determining protein RodA